MGYRSKTVRMGRSRTEIVMMILDAAKDEKANIKKLMQTTFIPSTDLKEYLSSVVEHQLLVYEQRNQTYITTEKGKRLLRMCSKMDQLTPNTT